MVCVFTSENLTHLTEQTYFPKSPNKKVLKKSSVKVGLLGQFGQVDESHIFIPGTSAAIRRQVSREQARLLEIPRSIEKAEALAPPIIKLRKDELGGSQKKGAGGGHRLHRKRAKNLLIARSLPPLCPRRPLGFSNCHAG